MQSRDTGTGRVLEQMIIPALGGYTIDTQVQIGKRPGGRAHKVDVVASRENRNLLISLKWQQVSGTVEQKVPFEVICLMDAISKNDVFHKAYLVLGGDGWTLREFYTSGGLQEYLGHSERVTILGLEAFIALANRGKL